MAEKWPKTIYVTREDPNTEDPYLALWESIESINSTEPVAEYQVGRIGQITTRVVFVEDV